MTSMPRLRRSQFIRGQFNLTSVILRGTERVPTTGNILITYMTLEW